MKVEQFYNKNQFIIKNEKTSEIVFQSYDSTIAKIKNGVLTLGKYWDYSNTTRKHLYLFIYDYAYKYSYLLNAANKRKSIERAIKEKKIKYNKDME